MQDFEIPRHKAALAAFAGAFDDGYADGKRALAAGAAKLTDVLEVSPIDVPRNNVLDDLWAQHVSRFREAGHAAALAERRREEAKLFPSEVTEDSPSAFDRDTFRWHVVLNPSRWGL